jgi:hypothetical protein
MPNPAIGVAGAGLSLLQGEQARKAASRASGAQVQASQEAIAEQRRQFDAMQALLKPYTEAGLPALKQQQALLGLAGPEAQQAAISAIENQPGFQAMLQQGENAMLQNASATGGLRGGNLQGALAQFRPQMLSQAIQDQYSRLGGMTALGQQSAAGVGTAGMQTGRGIADLLGQMGAARAGGYLGQAQAQNQMLGGLAQGFGQGYGFVNSPSFGNWIMGSQGI